MSLRIFHAIFIVVSITLCVCVTIWGLREYAATHNNAALTIAITFVAGGAVLLAYSGRVFRKLRDL